MEEKLRNYFEDMVVYKDLKGEQLLQVLKSPVIPSRLAVEDV